MSGKIVGSFLASILVAVVAFQVTGVSAHGKKSPITGPVTGPITSPSDCKPGWGFGDKNHCHSGPRGWFEKEEHHTSNINTQHKDNHSENNHNGNGPKKK